MSDLRSRLQGMAALLLFSIALTGCSDFDYYLHTAGGHLQIMTQRESIPELLEDQSTPEDLRNTLQQIARIRQFASDRLGLPENDSYLSYVALDRPYVVWNVVAAPELSLDPLEWCFPFAGCVQYRGYFTLEKAQRFAEGLQREGYDTLVSGVPAYSTLNWFDDPALSTFSHWPTSSIARLIFHELAHQKLYLQDDSTFNESFATTVAQVGVDRWLEQFGDQLQRERYRQRQQREKAFLELITATRNELDVLYNTGRPAAELRQRKADIFAELRLRYVSLKSSWNGYAGYDRWFSDLNNAKFASINTYQRWVPAFRQILDQEQSDLRAFYRRCEHLSGEPTEQRAQLLDELLTEPGATASEATRFSQEATN